MKNVLTSLFLIFFIPFIMALPSNNKIVSQVVQPDDPFQIDNQIIQSKMISFQSLYPDLYKAQRIPVEDNLDSRLLLPGSEMIPLLSSTLFEAEGLAGFEQTDPIS